MKISIIGDFPEGKCFYAEFNKEKKLLDDFANEVVFEVEQPQLCEIKIYQPPSYNNHSFFMVLIFVLTSIIQGVFNVLMLNTESKWFNNASPFCVYCTLTEFISSDYKVRFNYISSKYDTKTYTYSKPQLLIENVESNNLCVEYKTNYTDVSNCFFTVIKKLFSVGLICEILFVVLLFVSIQNNLIAGIIICTGLILFAFCLQLIMFIKEYNRLSKIKKILYESFS